MDTNIVCHFLMSLSLCGFINIVEPKPWTYRKRGKNAAASLGTIADVVCARSLCNSVPLYPDPELRAAGGCDHPVHWPVTTALPPAGDNCRGSGLLPPSPASATLMWTLHFSTGLCQSWSWHISCYCLLIKCLMTWPLIIFHKRTLKYWE